MTAEERARVLVNDIPADFAEDWEPATVRLVAAAIRAAEQEARADAERARAEADARYCDLMSRTERLVSEAKDEALERAAKALAERNSEDFHAHCWKTRIEEAGPLMCVVYRATRTHWDAAARLVRSLKSSKEGR